MNKMAGHKAKKRKTASDDIPLPGTSESTDTSKPSALFKPTKGRDFTLSIALPGSIIANAVTHDQKTALAGQIARACAVFCVDEVVVFDDGQASIRDPEQGGYTAFADPNFFLFHLLSYLETPPHMRRTLFPMHPDLRSAGALPSVDMPHHLRADEWSPYREGVTVKAGTGRDGSVGTLVDCGLRQHVFVPVEIESGVRVTLRLASEAADGPWEGDCVSPDEPRETAGYYWGYKVRQAASLSDVFRECPDDRGYEVSVGMSERGIPLASLLADDPDGTVDRVPPNWSSLLVAFGGVAGLEAAFTADRELKSAPVTSASEIFDYWINLVPGQGSRTIRTEEAVWIGLMGLQGLMLARGAH